MAVATYSTDLVTIASAEDDTVDPGTWAEMVGHLGGGAVTQETDYFIQGGACISQSTGTKTGIVCGLQYDYGSDLSASMPTGTCVFFWHVYLASNAVETFDSGGLRLMIGSTGGNFNFWKSGGSDFGRYPYGGWQNVAIDPRYPADYADGSPTGVKQFFGCLPNIVSAVSKGNPHGADCIRYGRGKAIIEDGESGSYGTFAALAAANDASANRWGLFQEIPGGYLWKGLISLGTTSTSVDFRDANISFVADITPRTYTSFNKIEVHDNRSRVDWTCVSISALGSASPGQFEMVNSGADVNLTTCTFTDMGSFTMGSGAAVNTCTFRGCDKLINNGATLTGCTIEDATTIAGEAFIICDDPEKITNCDFTYSDGHAIEFTTAGSFSWNGNAFTGYGVAETSAAAVYNNSGGWIQLNVTNATNPTARNASGASTVYRSSVTITITVKDKDNVAIETAQVAVYRADTGAELMNQDTDGDGIATTGATYAGDIYWRVRKSSAGDTKYTPAGGTGSTVGGLTLAVTLYEDPNA